MKTLKILSFMFMFSALVISCGDGGEAPEVDKVEEAAAATAADEAAAAAKTAADEAAAAAATAVEEAAAAAGEAVEGAPEEATDEHEH
ncbi:MAG: hypothetical protein ACI976_000995 [Aureispira sp.]|jgi:hypothetical protein